MSSNSSQKLSFNDRNLVAQFLHTKFSGGQLKRGAVKEAAVMFKVSRQSVNKIWIITAEQIKTGMPIHIPNLRNNSRKKRRDLDVQMLLSAKIAERCTIRGLGESLGVSSTTAWKWVKSGEIRPHSNAIKPALTEKCKMERLKFSLDAIKESNNMEKWDFKSMKHVIHIDEKWFYLSKTTEKYYLHRNEENPYRSCQSKKFITKVMFLCAVSRPMYNTDGSLIFDGKIGMFPFTYLETAKRNSKRRAAGTTETKAVSSITKTVIKSCLINQVLPAIKAKWPLFESTNIIIQQDNAKPHLDDGDLDFRAAASSDGFNIHLICQPSSSPDLNINDLGWFRALQALQTKRTSYTIDQLVDAVMFSFSELSHVKLNNVFLTLQSCMIEIMKVRGHNNYKIPHMKKAMLLSQGILPENLEVDAHVVNDCVQYIIDTETAESNPTVQL
ncbi:hypothetical protein OROHE_010301 [Orobanche hederae]